MSAGGSSEAGGPGGHGVALRAAGDRPAVRGRLRSVPAVLPWLDFRKVAEVGLIVDDRVPQILMFAGDPFLLVGAMSEPLKYHQVRPYRVDALVTDEVLR